STGPDHDRLLSGAVGRAVTLAAVPPAAPVLEEYWPALEGLPHQDTVTLEAMPPGAFFDAAAVHLLTTATLDRLREVDPAGRGAPLPAERRPQPPRREGGLRRGRLGRAHPGAGPGGAAEGRGPLPALRDDHPRPGGPARGPQHPAGRRAAQPGPRGRLRQRAA